MEKKRLYRSKDNGMVAGVLGGFAEYFDHDPTFWRLAFIILLILTGVMPGLLIYLIAWIMIPQEPWFSYVEVAPDENGTKGTDDET